MAAGVEVDEIHILGVQGLKVLIGLAKVIRRRGAGEGAQQQEQGDQLSHYL